MFKIFCYNKTGQGKKWGLRTHETEDYNKAIRIAERACRELKLRFYDISEQIGSNMISVASGTMDEG